MIKQLTVVFAVLVFVGIASAQKTERPRVFIEESDSWEIKGSPTIATIGRKRGTIVGGSTRGGAKPRTAEIMKRFDQQCKTCIVTMYKDKADFVVRVDHEGGENVFNKDNKLAVFNKDGDLISSGSFSRTRKAVEIACDAIMDEFRKQNKIDQSASTN